MKLPSKLKFLVCALALVTFVGLTETGCSKKIKVDTVNLDYSFQGDSTNGAEVSAAIQAIDNADYDTALTKLKKVAADPKLSSDQKQAVNGAISQLEKK